MLKRLLMVLMLVFMAALVSGDFDPTVDNWYDVEDWEVAICSKWGGTGQTQRHTGSVMATPLYEFAATVQGELNEYDMGENKTRIYEFSWYLQPINGQQEYTVTAEGSSASKIIAEGTAPSTGGDAGYFAIENATANYTSVILDYEDGKIKAPIIK